MIWLLLTLINAEYLNCKINLQEVSCRYHNEEYFCQAEVTNLNLTNKCLMLIYYNNKTDINASDWFSIDVSKLKEFNSESDLKFCPNSHRMITNLFRYQIFSVLAILTLYCYVGDLAYDGMIVVNYFVTLINIAALMHQLEYY